MTGEELQQARAARWQALQPDQVSSAALRAWVREIGFAELPALEAWALEAPAWVEAELAALHLIELAVWPGVHRYVPVELLEYIYVAVGDRHPRSDFRKQASRGQISWLAAEVFEQLLAAPGPLGPADLRERLGTERTSLLGLERALAELAPSLKVIRVGRGIWRPLVLALPRVPAAMDQVSLAAAAAALVSHWLDVNICDTEAGIAAYFAPLLSRSRIHDALNALETARQVTIDTLDGQSAFRLVTAKVKAPL